MDEEKMINMFSDLKDSIDKSMDNKIANAFSDLKDSIDKSMDNKIANAISELKDSMDKRFDAHIKEENERFDALEKRLDAHIIEENERFDAFEKKFMDKLEKQRLDLVKLEYNLGNKIDALFDARQISLEADEKINHKIISIDNILDNHGYRISELESKVN